MSALIFRPPKFSSSEGLGGLILSEFSCRVEIRIFLYRVIKKHASAEMMH